jgi:predicted NBD/HSP70 family sugar kinase
MRNTNNSTQISKQNKAAILNLIWKKMVISRAEIARLTGLSAAAVTRNVSSLIELGLVSDTGSGDPIRGGGRPPNLLVFNGDNNYIVGIDLGVSEIQGILTNLHAQSIAEMKVSIPPKAGFKNAMQRANSLVSELVRAAGVDWDRVCGVGMAVSGLAGPQKRTFGPEHADRNRISFSLAFPWEVGVVEEKVEDFVDLPCIFDKLSRTIVHGELWFGNGKEFTDFISVNFEHHSVAAGIIINGQPFSGIDGHGGGFGHITLDDSSDIQCVCGNYGCLQALTSSSGIEHATRAALESGAESMLREQCKGDPSAVTINLIIEAARAGDPLARSIYQKVAKDMGLGVAAMINIFNPQAIFIGGKAVTETVDYLYDAIVETAISRAISHLAKKVRILPATLGSNASRLGAVSMILEEIFNLNIKIKPPRREPVELTADARENAVYSA